MQQSRIASPTLTLALLPPCAAALDLERLRRHTDTFYDQIIGAVRPQLVIPVHWDNFTEPVSDDLGPLSAEIPAKFDDLRARLQKDGISFGIMQGYQSVILFRK